MSGMFTFVLFCVFSSCYATLTIEDDSYSSGRGRETEEDTCGPIATGIEWIMSRRNENYGWGLQTHRAVIAVFAAIRENRTYAPLLEQELMVNQLEVELSMALLRNNTGLNLPQSELALFIHALLVAGRNPRDFKGINLVRILERKMDDLNVVPHPFVALCLCNVGALKLHHLYRIRNFLTIPGNNAPAAALEMNAITLKAFACVEPEIVQNYEQQMEELASFLAGRQSEDGNFGNNFTTSIIVQALKAMKRQQQVNDALDFLREQQSSQLTTIYYIEMALRRTVFLKDYRQDDLLLDAKLDKHGRENTVFVKYSLKVGYLPNMYMTMSMHVPKHSTMFDVMKFAAKENFHFDFKHGLLRNNDPLVYWISGLPNNVEDGLYWRLYRGLKNDNDLNLRLDELTEPVNNIPITRGGEYIFQYLDLFTQA